MLRTYFEISLGISAVILLVMAIRPLVKTRYSAAMCCGIWLVCAVMLIIPFKFQVTGRIQIPEPENKIIMSARSEPQEEIQTEKTSFTEQTAVEAAPAKDTWAAIDLYGLLTAVWLCGAGAFMMYHIIGYILFCRKIRPWCKPIGLTDYNAKPRLTECALLKSPMLVGFIKPRIMLPRADYSEYELRMILKHELEHYRRGDLYKKLLLILANAVHWFNPLVYVMRSCANRDIEYSCDERVVRGMNGQEKKDYSLTILHCAAGGMQTAFSTYLNEDKKNLKQRFANILSGGKKRGIFLGVIVCALSVVCAGMFAISRDADSETPTIYQSVVTAKNADANYLFLGTDEDERIDAIMLASLEKDKKHLSVMSIPRDTVMIENWRTKSFNPSNIEKMIQAVSVLMDCHITAYLMTNTDSVMPLLEKAGGVKFDIPDLYGDGTGMVYDDPYKNLHINLNAGQHTLTAEEIMQVIRYRKSNVRDDGTYMTYDNGDADRINITNSLLGEILSQKKKALSDDIIETALEVVKNSYGNAGIDDIRAIYNVVAQGKVDFTLLSGEYENDVNLQRYYVPDDFLNLGNVLENPLNAADSVYNTYRVTKLVIDGEETVRETDGKFGIWRNERLGMLHLCLIPELSDGTYAVIQPYSDIEYDAELGKAKGKFVFKNMTKAEAGETIRKEIFDGTIIGLNTNTPTLESDDEKYLIQLLATELKY